MRILVLTLVGVSACGAPQPESPAPRALAATGIAPRPASSPTASARAPRHTASAAAPSAAPPATPTAKPSLAPVPCDLARFYAGRVDKTNVVARLAHAGDAISGLVHYDVPGAGIAVAGQGGAAAFTFEEKGGGTWKGACDPATGALSGTFRLRDKDTPFLLSPLGVDAVGVHGVVERSATKAKEPAVCAKPAKNGRKTEPDTGVCLPKNPKARAELLVQNPTMGRCSLALTWPRLFGMKSPAAEAAGNAVLAAEAFSFLSADVRKGVTECTFGAEIVVSGGYSLHYDARGVVALTASAWVDQTNAAHGASFGPEPLVLDTVTGRRVLITDLVKDERAFHDAVLKCDFSWRDELEWGPDAGRKKPRFFVQEGGLAVVIGDLAGPMRGAEGRGVFVSFAGLAGRGMLRADSPVARLWAGVTPAPPDAPLCTEIGGDGD